MCYAWFMHDCMRLGSPVVSHSGVVCLYTVKKLHVGHTIVCRPVTLDAIV